MRILGRCILYTGIRLLRLIRPFISSFLFLLNYQILKLFVIFFSGTVRSRRLKLGTHVGSGQMYRVYRNQAAAAYLSYYFFIFLSLHFSNIKFFGTLFSRTVRSRKVKLGTHVDSGQMYRIYRNQTAVAYSSFISSFFLSFQLSNIKIFCHIFLRNCEV